MANPVAKRQWRNLAGVVVSLLAVAGLVALSLRPQPKPKPNAQPASWQDDSLSDNLIETALSAEQAELRAVKRHLSGLKHTLAHQAEALKDLQQQKVALPPQQTPPALLEATPVLTPIQPAPIEAPPAKSGQIEGLSYHFAVKAKDRAPDNYVPSGTFAEAVILGGADADASVNAQQKNHGVMLLKLTSDGRLPNGASAPLKGCFVTASTYGDISSERAYVILDRLSCARPDAPLLDREVAGWVFFGGKVGVKGQAMMRDGKVLQWAGLSGALAGIAGAAQYAQSIQNVAPQGASSVVPSDHIGEYALYGGASRAADQLAAYYVKRAEQYHPVIQVGAGNRVEVVFKTGFSLLPDQVPEAEATQDNPAVLPDSVLKDIQAVQAHE